MGGVKHFLLRSLLLIVPFALLLGVVWLVDPYGMFHADGVVSAETKRKNLDHSGRTMAFSNVMWKLLEYERDPAENVIFGDSRLSYFDLDHLENVAGADHFNFGVPGGNYRTISDLYELATEIRRPKNVYIQVGFRAMRPGMDWDLVHEARTLAEKPLLYLTNRRVLEATALNLYSTWFPDRVKHDELPPDQWERVLGMEAANIDGFSLDESIFAMLEEIAEDCRKYGSKLVLIEYPTHPDVSDMYEEAGLMDLRQQYVARMSAIAPFIDLDQPGLFPSSKDYWRDPLHLTVETQRMVIDTVWGDRNGEVTAIVR